MAPKAKEKKDAPPLAKDEEPTEDAPEEPAAPAEPSEDEVTELSTGLVLPLRGIDVAQVWALNQHEEKEYVQQTKLIVGFMGLAEAFPSSAQRNIVCDFYMFNLIQAKVLCLTQVQGAVFLAIMHALLEMMRSPEVADKTQPGNMPNGQAACFKRFQELLLQHSVNRPPERLGIFRVSDAKMLTDFASTTLFKHFLLYQYCINFTQEVQTLRVCRPLQRPLPGPDLSAAQLKPRTRRSKNEQQGEGQGACEGGAPTAEEAGNGAVDEKTDPEDDEVDRIVAEKLRETEAALQAKFEAREESFKQKIAEKAAAAPKKKK